MVVIVPPYNTMPPLLDRNPCSPFPVIVVITVLVRVESLARPSNALLHTIFGCTLLLGIRLKVLTLQTMLQKELFREKEMLLRACIVVLV